MKLNGLLLTCCDISVYQIDDDDAYSDAIELQFAQFGNNAQEHVRITFTTDALIKLGNAIREAERRTDNYKRKRQKEKA